ncbi:carbon-nitrogen hydrolase family protein [Evansella cellulosilytica]|uniref:Nitrilase/cyanide hydratase and apolipoprotein N-acyltransferase n=1 Tax=Evansella cellulosilytica (strain ATCC 21833 / DSM 2522 / FERM P-1141 / JCM 9156 / N-4) TaxID=649639 RepID=E6TR70_EVAC2|nr:carbon-nitrogen hydrolase family protein [Evansella cellulosilytica]ADU30582.1 Nitrilase/cyanide hydratase and apolipoprotein N-acyltransferase [Evansella cellulosilytica DSM 2522]
MTNKVKIGMIQMLVEAGQIDVNIARACTMVREAAAKGCSIVVLPECMDIGWTYPRAKDMAYPIPGYCSDVFCDIAKELNIHVVVGLTERCGNHLYNTAIMISNVGEIILKHRKINELDFALDVYSVGDRTNVIDTEFGRIGLAVCADLRAENDPIGNTIGLMGARILLSPCSWAVRRDHNNEKEPYGQEWVDPYKNLANKYHMAVIGVSNVGVIKGGEWNEWKVIGCSLAVGRDGNVIMQGTYGEQAEELLIVEV